MRFWRSFHLLTAKQMEQLMDRIRTWFPAFMPEIYSVLLHYLYDDCGGAAGHCPYSVRASDIAHAFFTVVGDGTPAERSARAQTVAAEGAGWFIRWHEDALLYL